MNIVKTRHRNKIKDDFLIDYLILYIEREIATKFIIESIMYNFWDSKELKCVCVSIYWIIRWFQHWGNVRFEP